MRFIKPVLIYLLLFSSLFYLNSCSKDEDTIDEIEETNTKNNEPIEPRFGDHISCSIISPPDSVGLDTVYEKYINCSGIPIISSDKVDDLSLLRADSMVIFMLKGLDVLKEKMMERGIYVIIFDADQEAIELVPELADNPPNGPAAIFRFPFVVVPQSTLLCQYPWHEENALIHEFAHAMHLGGYNYFDDDFDPDLRALFSAAMSSGLWDNTYAAWNYREYFAEGVQSWYNVQWPHGVRAGDGLHNDITKRSRLENYDPDLYAFIQKYLNQEEEAPGCYQLPPD